MAKAHRIKLDPADAEDLQDLGRSIGQHLDENVLFSLWLFDLRKPDQARQFFVSSVDRESILAQTAAWLSAQLDGVEHFAYDKSEVKAEDVELIKDVARWLADILLKVQVKLPPPTGSTAPMNSDEQGQDNAASSEE